MHLCQSPHAPQDILLRPGIALPSLIPELQCVWDIITVPADQISFFIRKITVNPAAGSRKSLEKFLLLLKLLLRPLEFFQDKKPLLAAAEKRPPRAGCGEHGQAVLFQRTESIIIQIKIPLLFLYLLSYVPLHAEMQKRLPRYCFMCSRNSLKDVR